MYRVVVLVLLACAWLRCWAHTVGGEPQFLRMDTEPQFLRMDTAQQEYDGFIDGWEAT
jgi:hypothetical protein